MTAEPKEQTVPKWARQARNLSEALGIKTERHLALATMLTASLENDASAPETLQTFIFFLKEGRISHEEAAFLMFDIGWITALNVISRTIDTQIAGTIRFNRKTGDIEDA